MTTTPIWDNVSRNMALAIESGDLKGRILALQNIQQTINAIPDKEFNRESIETAIQKTLANYRALKAVNTRRTRKGKNV